MKRIAMSGVALFAAVSLAAPAAAAPPCTHGECIRQVQAIIAKLLER